MEPTFPHPAIGERYQNADGEHGCIAFRLGSRLVEEGTDASVLIMNEISVDDQHLVCVSGSCTEAHTKSSLTLCRPEGRDLYSTTPSMSTAIGSVGFHSDVGRTLTFRNRPSPCYGVTDGSLAILHSESLRGVLSHPLRMSNLTRKAAAIGGNVWADRAFSPLGFMSM